MENSWIDEWWSHRLDPASFWQRLAAAVIDALIVLAAMTAYYWFFRGFGEVWSRFIDPVRQDPASTSIFVEFSGKILGLSFLALIVYGVLMEPAPWSGTLGKRLVGIRVVDGYGERLTMTAAIVRNLTKIISIGALGIGVLAIFWRPGKQAWHDRVAHSFVARG